MIRGLLLLVLCLIVGPADVRGQTFGRVEDLETSGTSYHVFAMQGEPTVQVLVVGHLSNTGIYEVGVDTDLAKLMTLAGGVSLGPRERGETREITVRVFRQESGRRSTVYESSLQEMFMNPERYPSLRDGDILDVEAVVRRRRDWTQIVRTVASFATLALAVDRLLNVR